MLSSEAQKRAKEMHDECMRDPEYAAKWNALVASLSGVLCDLPADALGEQPCDPDKR